MRFSYTEFWSRLDPSIRSAIWFASAALCGASSLVACASSDPVNRPGILAGGGATANAGGASGASSSTTVAGAGSGGASTAGAYGSVSGAAGASVDTGGTGGAVSAGAGGTSSGGDSAAGANAAGAGGSDVLPPACGKSTGNEPSIDDFEANVPQVKPVDGRSGNWETFDDTSAGGVYSARTSAPGVGRNGTVGFCTNISGYKQWGANIVANMANPKCGYDATPYTGVCFWAKGKVTAEGPILFAVGTSDTVPATSGGACVSLTGCNAHYEGVIGKSTASPNNVTLTDTYAQYCYKWSELSARPKPFDKAHIVQMEWKFPAHNGKSTDGSICIDDITFTKM